MINISRNFAITASENGDRSVISTLMANPASPHRSGSQNGRKSSLHTINALEVPLRGGGSGNGGSVAQTSTTNANQLVDIVQGMVPDGYRERRKIFKDIYYHDPIGGGVVDVYSKLPFSNFDLVGIKDQEVLEKYHQCVEALRPSKIIPALSAEKLVMGNVVCSLIFDKERKIFTNIMPQRSDACEFIELPFYGMDPLINISIPKTFIELLRNKKDRRIASLLNSIPEELRQQFEQGKIELQPENTLFMARRGLTSDALGTSMYERMLPIWMLEKALVRGTIDQAWRRQRSTTHIMVGDVDEWIPTAADLASVRDMFLQADMDPTGAFVVTRTGLQINDIRAPNDFWRVDEMADFINSFKYRALNASEDIITGAATLSTLDASLSLMLQDLRDHRKDMENDMFHDKIFPLIAAANNFTKEQGHVITSKINDHLIRRKKFGRDSSIISYADNHHIAVCADARHEFRVGNQVFNLDELEMPRIVWAKHLSPEGDDAYLTMLDGMVQRGIPITLAMFATAGGINLNSLLESLDEDVNVRQKIAAYKEKIAEFEAPADGSDQDVQAKVLNDVLSTISRPSLRPSLVNREYGEDVSLRNRYKNGKYRTSTVKGRNKVKEKLLRDISTVMSNRAKIDNAKMKKAAKEGAKTMSSNRFGKIT